MCLREKLQASLAVWRGTIKLWPDYQTAGDKTTAIYTKVEKQWSRLYQQEGWVLQRQAGRRAEERAEEQRKSVASSDGPSYFGQRRSDSDCLGADL